MPDMNFSSLISVKVLYVKLICLIDQEKNKGQPIYKRKIRRSGEEFPVYDSSVFYQFTQFGTQKSTDHKWRFTSSEGQVDALQLHPFDSRTLFADPAKITIHKSVEGYLRPTPDTLLVISHNYNGFQRENGEWVGVRADNDTGLLRIVVDFSSVMIGGENELFYKEPSAYLVHELEHDVEKRETLLELEFNDGRVFSVSQENVLKENVIKMRYKMNWDSLATWHAYHKNKNFVPEMML